METATPRTPLVTYTRSVSFDAPRHRIEKLIHREFQTSVVRSIDVLMNRAEVEVECPCFSEVISETSIESVPIIETWHHSAVLPRWLDFLRDRDDLAVLHVDSHSDLGSPNLIKDAAGQVIDRWTEKPVSASSSTSVRSAVDSSAIEIGNYLTAAIFLLPIRGIAWFSPPVDESSIQLEPATLGLMLEWSESDPLNSSLCRLRAIRGVPLKDLWYLEASAAACDALAKLNDVNFILDIDLDYFDNSDHLGHWRRVSATTSQRVEMFTDLLRRLDPARVVAVSLARSPGFCPPVVASCLSAEIIGRLRLWLRQMKGRAAGGGAAPSSAIC